ncbi:hypothetical protein SAMN05421684_0934 [Asanoa ishikariensis]|uniref:Transcriptional activator domain-containing protein n=1 Tax=Asanoa ishikariensis TaxID=137265 RepID=A0A1H3LTN1_9ACTN|nr:hypothetical protein [Asanoa ishikariensis]SDY67195.1 hypothetical protein SAMN05421684_0934 [Asanoa ishikariensis]
MALEVGDERTLAAELFNRVWDLLERTDRSPADDDTMLHMAHATRHHWGQVGEPVNLARGEWQCSRVYSVRGRAEPATHHAQRCLDLCIEHGIGDFDLAYAYEALARAALTGGDQAAAALLEQARGAAARIAEADDRALVEADLQALTAKRPMPAAD